MGDAREGLDAQRGTVVTTDDPIALAKAIDLAFDYRGDITVHRRGDATPIEGYLFDRRRGEAAASHKCVGPWE